MRVKVINLVPVISAKAREIAKEGGYLDIVEVSQKTYKAIYGGKFTGISTESGFVNIKVNKVLKGDEVRFILRVK